MTEPTARPETAPADRPTPEPQRVDGARRRWRWGLIFSAAVHLVLLGVLIYVPYTWWLSYQKLLTGEPADPVAKNEAADPSRPEASGEASGESKAPPLPREALSSHAELLPAGPVGDKLREYVAGVEKLSPEKKQEKLRELADQLNQVSNPEAVDAMTEKFHEWMEVPKREAPKDDAAVEGPFDYQTAQVDDVRRKRDENGKWVYTSVLVDAKGRKLDTPIDAATGEQLYPTFELIRSNPLVGQIYRQMAMPLLDKAMQSAQNADSTKQAIDTVVPKK